MEISTLFQLFAFFSTLTVIFLDPGAGRFPTLGPKGLGGLKDRNFWAYFFAAFSYVFPWLFVWSGGASGGSLTALLFGEIQTGA